MRILIDTHIAIWAMVGSPKLSVKARTILSNGDNEFFLSAASLWEVALKHTSSAKDIPVTPEMMQAFCFDSGISALGVSFLHAVRTASLPPIHADPFDRMLIAQAQCESLLLLTHDSEVAKYGSFVLKA
jgi:PIN domain nuclease of toxin-antitoxin system